MTLSSISSNQYSNSILSIQFVTLLGYTIYPYLLTMPVIDLRNNPCTSNCTYQYRILYTRPSSQTMGMDMYNTDYIFITLWQIHNTSRPTKQRRNKKIWANDGWADNTCVALLARDRPTDSHEESCGKWMWKYILNEWTSLNTNFVVFYLLFSCANKCDRPHPMRSPFSVLNDGGATHPRPRNMDNTLRHLHRLHCKIFMARAEIRTLGWTNWRPSRMCETTSTCKT